MRWWKQLIIDLIVNLILNRINNKDERDPK